MGVLLVSPRRRKWRGARPAALITFDHGQLVDQPDPADNPILRPCTHCRAAPGNPCTRPGRRGARVPITGYHDSRQHQEQQ
ncbi:MAG: hypothetical protein ACJ72N_06965 [Labedaea sp.]